MHHSKTVDVLSVTFFACSMFLADHWLSILAGALVIWRAAQAFVLEPLGIFWPRPKREKH